MRRSAGGNEEVNENRHCVGRLASADQWGGHDARADHRGRTRSRARGAAYQCRRPRIRALSQLSRDPPGVVSWRRSALAIATLRARGNPHCDRGPAGTGGARLLSGPPPGVHELLSHAVSRLRAPALGRSGRPRLRLSALVSSTGGAHPGRYGKRARKPAGTRFRAPGALVARCGYRDVSTRCEGAAGSRGALAASDHVVRRPRRGREERRRVPRAAHAGHQSHRGRRSGAR